MCFVFLWKSPPCLHLEYLFAGTGRWTTPHPEEFQREFSSLTTSVFVLFCFLFLFLLSFTRKTSKRWTLWEINVTKRSTVAWEEYRCLRGLHLHQHVPATLFPRLRNMGVTDESNLFYFQGNAYVCFASAKWLFVGPNWCCLKTVESSFFFLSAKVISAVASTVPDGHVKVVSNTSYWPRQAELANVLVSHSTILHLA